jgi:hypothetical protein
MWQAPAAGWCGIIGVGGLVQLVHDISPKLELRDCDTPKGACQCARKRNVVRGNLCKMLQATKAVWNWYNAHPPAWAEMSAPDNAKKAEGGF